MNLQDEGNNMFNYSKIHSVMLSIALVFLVGACDSNDIRTENNPSTHRDEIVFEESVLNDHIAVKGIGHLNQVSVMTRNMYVGTDVDNVMMAQTVEEIPIRVAEAFALLQATDTEGRIATMAKEIALRRPHLVGLQEVTRVRLQTPGDAVAGGSIPAEDEFLDFLPMLLSELSARGASYTVAARIENFDIELPMITDATSFSFTDVRLTDSDVILARSDVAFDNIDEANYAASFSVFGAEIRRGYVAVDATISGLTYRFYNTHLEPVETGSGIVQGAQAAELLAILASETLPLIVVGDFNSDAPSGATYTSMLDAGFGDAWAESIHTSGDGYTCCQAKDLSNRESMLDRRIDYVFVKNNGGSPDRPITYANVIGLKDWNRTRSGLWPSDHAAVFARMGF